MSDFEAKLKRFLEFQNPMYDLRKVRIAINKAMNFQF